MANARRDEFENNLLNCKIYEESHYNFNASNTIRYADAIVMYHTYHEQESSDKINSNQESTCIHNDLAACR